MRALTMLLAFAMITPLMPSVAAEYGDEVNGYPVGEGGFLHDPTVRFEPEALAAIQERFANDYPQLNRIGPATVYPYYPILAGEIERLKLDHGGDKLNVQVGKSTLGLDIHYLEIANFYAADEPGFIPIEDREVIMIDGGTHSNEYSGVYFVLALAQWLLDGSPEDELAEWILENRYVIITPMTNPDGSNAMGRLNSQAVNINRNFPVLWGGDGTDMLLNNPGPSAMSEIETQLIVDRVEHYQPDYHASIHCCGNLWLFPYGEDGYDPLDVDMMNRVCDVAYPEAIRSDCGPIWSTIYPASGSTVDTVYEYTGAVPFGFEMSGRSNLAGPWGEPVTFAEVEAQEQESWDAVLHAFENVHLYGGYPVIDRIDLAADTFTITITNAGLGNLTGSITLADSGDAASTVADLPLLTPGETVTLAMDAPAVSDAYRLVVDYQKRIMTSPMGQLGLDLSIANGTVTATLPGHVTATTGEVAAVLGDVTAQDSEAPGVGLFALLGAVALALIARRR